MATVGVKGLKRCGKCTSMHETKSEVFEKDNTIKPNKTSERQ